MTDKNRLETAPVIDSHCHIDLDWNSIQTTPAMMLDLMNAFPETRLILYHACPVEETISMINDFPHVYTDTSYTAGSRKVQQRLLETVSHSRILFGIDSPLGFPKNESTYLPHFREFVVSEFAEWYDYDREILEKVLYKNSSDLLNLEIADRKNT